MTLIGTSWGGYRSNWVPPQLVKSFEQGAIIDAKLAGPIKGSLGFTFVGDPMGCLPISRLLCARNPSAVIWVVASIVILSVQLKTWAERVFHIRNEMGDVMPALTHFDASAAVMPPSPILGVITAVHHVGPALVQPMLPQTVPSGGLHLEAAATDNAASTQTVQSRNMVPGAAIAIADGVGFSAPRSSSDKADNHTAMPIPDCAWRSACNWNEAKSVMRNH